MAKSKSNNHGSRAVKNKTNPYLYALFIGLYAGVIWGVVRWMFYGLKFTKELPGYWLEPFFQNSFLKTYWGAVAGIGSFIVFSIAAAFIYLIVLYKFKGAWPGVIYGFVWWFIIFVFIGPWLKMTTVITKAGWETLSAELCICLLWGSFIGYSISFELNDEASREPASANKDIDT